MSNGLDGMSNDELIKTLRIASESVKDNIALAMILIIAAERIEMLQEHFGVE